VTVPRPHRCFWCGDSVLGASALDADDLSLWCCDDGECRAELEIANDQVDRERKARQDAVQAMLDQNPTLAVLSDPRVIRAVEALRSFDNESLQAVGMIVVPDGATVRSPAAAMACAELIWAVVQSGQTEVDSEA
jgi:hypothetical protein